MSEEREAPGSEQQEISDLVGVELVAALGIWFLVVLACFFFIGVVVGIIALLLGVIGFGWYLVAAVRRADISD